MRVPECPPTQCVNYTFVELGFTGDAQNSRFAADPADHSELRVIYNANTFALCNIIAYRGNTSGFHLTTVSEVGINGGFVINGDASTSYAEVDWTPPLRSLCILGLRRGCRSFLDFPSSSPVTQFSANGAPFPAAT